MRQRRPGFIAFCITLMLLLSNTIPLRAATPDLQLDSQQKQQGEFFTATVSGLQKAPRLWFNGSSYHMFLQNDGTFRALIPVDVMLTPGMYAILAINESWKEKIPVEVSSNGLSVQKVWLDKKTSGLRATQEEKAQVKTALHRLTDQKQWSGLFLMPATGRKSSPFGVKRSYNGAPVSSYHKGIDIAAPQGTIVKSPADGKIILTGYESNRFHVHGNTVIIDHGQGLTSVYLHLNAIKVNTGDIVKKGDPIATIGSTGISTGPHLHWGVYLYGTSVNPELFVRNEY